MSKNDKNALNCSFCGKGQKEVKKLIAGPNVYICDECIELCNEIISEELEKSENQSIPSGLPTPIEITESKSSDSIAHTVEQKFDLSRDRSRSKIVMEIPKVSALQLESPRPNRYAKNFFGEDTVNFANKERPKTVSSRPKTIVKKPKVLTTSASTEKRRKKKPNASNRVNSLFGNESPKPPSSEFDPKAFPGE